MDQGDLNTPFSKVTSYGNAGGQSASILTHTLTHLNDGLIIGKIYTFKFRSENSVGYSDFSLLTRVGFGKRVIAPLLSYDVEQAAATHLTLTWSKVPDAELITLGYSLELL